MIWSSYNITSTITVQNYPFFTQGCRLIPAQKQQIFLVGKYHWGQYSIANFSAEQIFKSFLTALRLIARIKAAHWLPPKTSKYSHKEKYHRQILKSFSQRWGWLLVSRPQIDWRQNSERPGSRHWSLSQLRCCEIFTPLINNPNSPKVYLWSVQVTWIKCMNPRWSPVDLIWNTNYSFFRRFARVDHQISRELKGTLNVAFFAIFGWKCPRHSIFLASGWNHAYPVAPHLREPHHQRELGPWREGRHGDDVEQVGNRKWEMLLGGNKIGLGGWPTERPVNHRPVFSPFFPVQISFVQQRQIGEDFNDRLLFLASWLWYSSARGGGEKLCSVWNLSSLQCVFPLLHCTSQTAGSQVCRAVAVVPTTAQTLFSATFAQKLLLRLVPEQIPFKHSCEGPDDMPAHAKVVIFYISYAPYSPPGLPSWFQPHPSHLRRSSDSRHLAGDNPPHP